MTQHNRETLLALAERCEKATGGDRELDEEIGAAIGKPSHFTDDEGSRFRITRRYTASLDAAMSLVPEGDLHLEIKRGKVWAFVGSPIRAATAATPALALCAAALRARATLDPTGEKA